MECGLLNIIDIDMMGCEYYKLFGDLHNGDMSVTGLAQWRVFLCAVLNLV
jgi:hypothetical protein